MNAPVQLPAVGGLADVQARIAGIQARINGLVGSVAAGPVPVFDLPAPEPADDPTESTADQPLPAPAPAMQAPPVTVAPSFAPPVAPPTTLDGSPATAAPTPVVPGVPGPDPTTSAPPVEGAAVAFAARLPAAGQRWAGAIHDVATRNGLDPSLFAALVRHESNFDQGVVSRAGAIGLAQLMPGTAAGLRVDPHDPLQNLEGGARYLRQQLDRFGSPDLALAAYNAGPNRVAQAGGVPRIAETQTYVARVLRTWEQYR